MSEPMVITQGLTKSFGDVQALKGIDLAVEEGTVFGLLGPNGAGKTTAVRILTTLLSPDSGSARVAGFDVVKDAEKLRTVIGLAGQYAAVDETLTGRENLVLVGRLYHLPREIAAQRAADVLDRFGLSDAADRSVKTYSGGMRRRLDLGASLVGRPRVLFLDEPTTGLDPRSRVELWGLIEELVRDGTTLLLTTQYLEEADLLSDRVAVIDDGRVIAEGTPDELKRQAGGAVVELHLEDRTRTGDVVDKLRGLAGEPVVDEMQGQITIPVGADAATVLTEVVRRLDAEKVVLADIALRRPTLDDVFMRLTGHGAESAAETGPRRARGRKRAQKGASV